MRGISTFGAAVALACGACQPLPDVTLGTSAGQPQPMPTAGTQPPPAQPICSSYTVPLTVGGQPQNAVVEACQQADGSWRVTQTTPGLPPQVYEVPPPAASPYPSAYSYPEAYPYPDFSPYWGWSDWALGLGRGALVSRPRTVDRRREALQPFPPWLRSWLWPRPVMALRVAPVMGSRACAVAAWAAAGTASRAFSGSNLVTRGAAGDNSASGQSREAGRWACNRSGCRCGGRRISAFCGGRAATLTM